MLRPRKPDQSGFALRWESNMPYSFSFRETKVLEYPFPGRKSPWGSIGNNANWFCKVNVDGRRTYFSYGTLQLLHILVLKHTTIASNCPFIKNVLTPCIFIPHRVWNFFLLISKPPKGGRALKFAWQNLTCFLVAFSSTIDT